MSSDTPPKTQPDNTPPAALPSEPPRPEEFPLRERWTEEPQTEVQREPTMGELLHAINALADEVRGAVSQIGETYGERIEKLEAQMRDIRLERANGSTHHGY